MHYIHESQVICSHNIKNIKVVPVMVCSRFPHYWAFVMGNHLSPHKGQLCFLTLLNNEMPRVFSHFPLDMLEDKESFILNSQYHIVDGLYTQGARALIQYRDVVLPVKKCHFGDKPILRPSYLHNGISYTGKAASSYWIGARGVISHGIDLFIPEYSGFSNRWDNI